MDVTRVENLLRCAEATDDVVVEIDGYELPITGILVCLDGKVVIKVDEDEFDTENDVGPCDDDEDPEDYCCAVEGVACAIPEPGETDLPKDKQA